MTTAPVIDFYKSFQIPGPVHLKDFTLLFCSNPDCSNLCETEGTNVRSTATFTCRACNPVSGFPNLSWYQFEVKFQEGKPQGTTHIGHQGSSVWTADEINGAEDTSYPKQGKLSDKKFLLRFFDNTDNMITGGQTLKKRLVERPCPEWMLDDREVQNFIESKFPKMRGACGFFYPECRALGHIHCRVDKKQWSNSLLWCVVINNYHRLALPAAEIASDYGLDQSRVEKIVMHINRRHAGLRVDGRPLKKSPISTQPTESKPVIA
jgi:hypothetical protein